MFASAFSWFPSIEALFLLSHHHSPILWVFASQFYVVEAPDSIITRSTQTSNLVPTTSVLEVPDDMQYSVIKNDVPNTD